MTVKGLSIAGQINCNYLKISYCGGMPAAKERCISDTGIKKFSIQGETHMYIVYISPFHQSLTYPTITHTPTAAN